MNMIFLHFHHVHTAFDKFLSIFFVNVVDVMGTWPGVMVPGGVLRLQTDTCVANCTCLVKHPHILGFPDKSKSHVTVWACAESVYAAVTQRCLDQSTTLTYYSS